MIRRFVGLVICALAFSAACAEAAPIAPPGLQPGDTYQRIFVTSFDVEVVTSNSFPPSKGVFGSVAGGDWNVNRAAYEAGLNPGWNGLDLPWKALLSDTTTNAKDHISIHVTLNLWASRRLRWFVEVALGIGVPAAYNNFIPTNFAAPVALSSVPTRTDPPRKVMPRKSLAVAISCSLALVSFAIVRAADSAKPPVKTVKVTKSEVVTSKGDWAQWGGSTTRNNTPQAKNIPSEWDVGGFNPKTGEWQKERAKHIKWAARLGSQSYGNPVVADGKVWVGSNNGAGYLKRYPSSVDLGVLLCFNEADGKFLWQHSSEKLPTGRVHDWPLQGICCAPLVEGKRLWFVTSRGEVKCLDTEGFHDDENDGPYKDEKFTEQDEADTIWELNMMKELGVSQHNMCACSVTAAGDLLFVNTSNGVDEGHINLPAPAAPSFICLDKNTGKVLWTDNSPGTNVLHGQWSSPTYGELGGVKQLLFGGGDGWLYSFNPEGKDGKSELLWKFDCNPKKSKYTLGGRADRNHIIGTPVMHDGLVYIGVGEDPEHGEGVGHLWCIDPTKRGDVSPELVFNTKDPKTPIPHKRNQACVEADGDFTRDNPNSAAVWHYAGFDKDGNGKLAFEETMHRTCGTVAIQDGLLFVADFSGLFHCLDVKTGKPHWTYDMLAAAWGSPLIADGKVYIGDEDGDITVFAVSASQEIINESLSMGSAVYSTPIVANGVLFISNKDHLFAIEQQK